MNADKILISAVFVFILTLVLPCGPSAQAQAPTETPAQKDAAPPRPVEKLARAVHYDFPDVVIPSELTLDKKASFVYSTSQSKVGVLVFSGQAEPASLATFFQSNMQKDGWKLLTSFKYREYLMVFVKEDRTCVISIYDKTFSTGCEVRLGPLEPGAFTLKNADPLSPAGNRP